MTGLHMLLINLIIRCFCSNGISDSKLFTWHYAVVIKSVKGLLSYKYCEGKIFLLGGLEMIKKCCDLVG